jgi:hypothetical protein
MACTLARCTLCQNPPARGSGSHMTGGIAELTHASRRETHCPQNWLDDFEVSRQSPKKKKVPLNQRMTMTTTTTTTKALNSLKKPLQNHFEHPLARLPCSIPVASPRSSVFSVLTSIHLQRFFILLAFCFAFSFSHSQGKGKMSFEEEK